MSISLVGSPWSHSGNNQLTLSVSPASAGNLMTLAFDDNDSRVQSSACSGGGVTTWNLAKSVIGTNYPAPVEIWWGVVTSTGASTITLTNSGVDGGDFTRLWAAEWNSTTAGTWSLLTTGSLPGNGLAFNYPSITGSGLYFGVAGNDFGTLTAGATSGFTYTVVDGHLMMAYNTAASGTEQPNGVTSDSGADITAIAALFNVTASAAAPYPAQQEVIRARLPRGPYILGNPGLIYQVSRVGTP